MTQKWNDLQIQKECLNFNFRKTFKILLPVELFEISRQNQKSKMRFLRLSSLILLTDGLIKGPNFKLETEFLSPDAIEEFLENVDDGDGARTY